MRSYAQQPGGKRWPRSRRLRGSWFPSVPPLAPGPTARVPSAVPLRVAAETSERLAGLLLSRGRTQKPWQPKGRSALPEHRERGCAQGPRPRGGPGTTIPRRPRGRVTRAPAPAAYVIGFSPILESFFRSAKPVAPPRQLVPEPPRIPKPGMLKSLL